MEGEERKGEYEGSSISMHSWQPACPRVPGRRCAQASHLGSKQLISLASGHAIRGCHLMTSLIQSNLSSFAEAARNELAKLIRGALNIHFRKKLGIWPNKGDECQSLSVTFTLRTSLLYVLGRPYMTSCNFFMIF